MIASTGRPQEADYLKGLGAAEIIDRGELASPAEAARQGALGRRASTRSARTRSPTCWRMTKYGGAVAACGLADGMDLPTSVAPFILRGVTLLGIDCVMAPKALRIEAWRRLARDLDTASSPP